MTEKTQQLAQIERLLSSYTLHRSKSLCTLLRYLANNSWERPGACPKEYQIATEVFRRRDDFDPRFDSVVRVQTGRLRSKLEEYYAREGNKDQILVELPKGNYDLIYRDRTPSVPETNGETVEQSGPSPVAESRSPGRWFVLRLSIAIVLSAVLAIAVDRSFVRFANDARAAIEPAQPPLAYRVFWKGFLARTQEPWIIFSDVAFVGRPDTRTRFFDPARDTKAPILDHYTGVGEVLAVHTLDKVFGSLHQDLRVKRGSLFSLDDAKNNDLILIGSPSENPTLLEIVGTKQFVFKQITAGVQGGKVAIINVHPQPGEPKAYLATPSEQALTEDYSVVALTKGLDRSRSVLILAGTTTIGTQAAVEYVCQQSSLEQLLLRLSVSNSGDVKPFEAVLRVKVAKGVPVESELIALRKGP
jgi:hypothetical protein